MNLHSKLILSFSALVSLLLAVGLISFSIDRNVRTQLADLRASRGVDLSRVNLENVGLEIEGFWDPQGRFVARRVELIAERRRPKLRGEIQSTNADLRTLTVYDVPIRVVSETEFIDAKAPLSASFADLRPGQRIEVNCDVIDGRWTARKIKTRDVKTSDKIKGTVTAVDLDGRGLETVDLHGLRISLAPTQAGTPMSALGRIELATRMTLTLQDFRAAAHELVGRTISQLDVDNGRLPDRDRTASTVERLIQAKRNFDFYLERSNSEGENSEAASLTGDFMPWLRALKNEQANLRDYVDSLQDLAPADPNGAHVLLDEVIDPYLQNELLPLVYAYRSELESALADRIAMISSRTDATMRVALGTFGVAAVLALVLGIFLARSMDQPLRALKVAAMKIGQGQLDTRVEIESQDELGILANAFNTMAERLATTTVSLGDLERVLDSMAGALIIFDGDGRIIRVNRAAMQLIGDEREHLIGQTFNTIFPVPRNGLDFPSIQATDEGIVAIDEKRLLRRDGLVIPVSFSGAELRTSDGRIQGYVCVAQDLTDLKHIEECLRSSLLEKDLLLREVHHRVKNNMQVISSLLSIQSSEDSDSRALERINESQSRIRSMAFIHEQLCHSANSGEVNLSAYLEQLTSHLVSSFGRSGSVTVELSVEDVSMDFDHALACGLIVNELVSNVLKHALSDVSSGKIRVSLSQNEASDFVLSVADDGCGIRPDGPTEDTDTLGLTLVETLAKQFQARMAFVGENGTEVRIVFPGLRSALEVTS